jgi:hypothetical protein
MLCCSVVGTIVGGPAASYFHLILVHFKRGAAGSLKCYFLYMKLFNVTKTAKKSLIPMTDPLCSLVFAL